MRAIVAFEVEPDGAAAGVNLIALSSKLSSNCRNKSSSPRNGVSWIGAISMAMFFALSQHARGACRLCNKFVQVKTLRLKRTPPCVGARQGEHLFDDAR
jgi:hypothetical protein